MTAPPTPTPYGSLCIGARQAIFRYAQEAVSQARKQQSLPISLGLTGGSTPKDFYNWVTHHSHASQELSRGGILWSTSDERLVPIEDPESNFGNADRLMLRPLGVGDEDKLPWPVDQEPHRAAQAFNENWRTLRGRHIGFDVCFLGMGDDAHTASIFPGSPLIDGHEEDLFTAIEAPEKGWRLTITPSGLKHCGRIIVMVTGESKAAKLKEVLQGDYHPRSKPIQWLKNCAEKVTWLIDKEAAKELVL